MSYELIGYLASVLVAVSLMMSSIVKLRIINLVGAVCFTVYGLVIHAYPVASVNAFIIIIDTYYLIEMFSQKEYFTILEVHADSEYLKRFLLFYQRDIARFFPDVAIVPSDTHMIFFVLRNMVPTGLFIAETRDRQSLMTILDFVIPGYRDFKIGEFIFSKSAEFFLQKGFRTLYSPPSSQAHEAYLHRMGFRQADAEKLDGLYVKVLA